MNSYAKFRMVCLIKYMGDMQGFETIRPNGVGIGCQESDLRRECRLHVSISQYSPKPEDNLEPKIVRVNA